MNKKTRAMWRLGSGAVLPAAALLAATPSWAKTSAATPPQAPAAPATPAPTTLDVNIALLDTLLHNGVITQAQYDQLAGQVRARDAALAAQARPVPTTPPSDQQIATGGSGPGSGPISSGGGVGGKLLKQLQLGEGITFKLGGRIQTDFGFGMGDKTRTGTQDEVRRSRLDFSGNLGPNFDYMVSYDFGTEALKNAYLEYIGMKDTTISVGYFKEYFSLEYQTSNKATEFQERSMLDDSFDPPKRLGIGYFRNSKFGQHSEFTFGIGAFGDAVPADTDRGEHAGFGIATRGTIVPIRTDRNLLHLGLSYEYRDPGKTEEIDLAAHPNAHFAPQLIDTGDILNVDKQYKYSAEFAGDLGRLSVQAQYDGMKFTRFGESTLNFHGWYAQASLFLTDDARAQAYDGGSYGTIKPHNKKWGAWQLAVRYDTQNLNTRDIIGGKETNVDGALNWYVNNYVRFSVNYIKVLELDRPGDVHNGDHPTIVAGRMWIGF